MSVLRVCVLFSILLFLDCLPLPAAASPRSSGTPLDDTFGTVSLVPDTVLVLACTPVSIAVNIALTDARVFDLQFAFDPARLQFLSAIPGSDPSLHLMPPSASGGSLLLDGFFHPNFTGTAALAILNFYVNPVTDDDTTIVRFAAGQGYSGTENSPIPIQFSGDSTVILIEGTPPEPPTELLITRLNYPAHGDSVLLQWHPVFFDVDGDTLINPLYVVYREHVVPNPGVFDSIGSTPDTFLYDPSIILNPDPGDVKNASTLRVVVRKTQP
jgi:hypothetical protein